jgi:GNAT superfamily N-acetyltransferase
MLCCGSCDNGQAHVECIMRFTSKITLEDLFDDWFCSTTCGEIDHYLSRLCNVKQAIRPTVHFPDIKRFSFEVVHRNNGQPGKRAAIQACKILKETFDPCAVGDFDLLEMVSLSLGGDDNYRPSTGYGAPLSTTTRQNTSFPLTRANRSDNNDDDFVDEEEEGNRDDDVDYPFDCSGFRSFILRDNRNIIAVATLRIFGTSFAEMPFFTTREAHRGKGYARLMLHSLEDVLHGLQIKYLVVPSLKGVEQFWRKLGFGRVTTQELRLLVNRVVEPDPASTRLLKKEIYSSPTPCAPRVVPSAPFQAQVTGRSEQKLQEVTVPSPSAPTMLVIRRHIPHLTMPMIDTPFGYDVHRDSDDCVALCAPWKAHLKVRLDTTIP